jgi:hypothetical protein
MASVKPLDDAGKSERPRRQFRYQPRTQAQLDAQRTARIAAVPNIASAANDDAASEPVQRPAKKPASPELRHFCAANIMQFRAAFGWDDDDTCSPREIGWAHVKGRGSIEVNRKGRLHLCIGHFSKADDARSFTVDHHLDLPRAYAAQCGANPKKLSAPAWRVWARRLLLDAGLIAEALPPFRTPHVKYRDLLCPNADAAHVTARVANGLAKLIVLEDPSFKEHAKRGYVAVPYSYGWIETWIGAGRPGGRPVTKQQLQTARYALIKAGVLGVVGKGLQARYFVRKLGPEDPGLDAAGLMHTLMSWVQEKRQDD